MRPTSASLRTLSCIGALQENYSVDGLRYICPRANFPDFDQLAFALGSVAESDIDLPEDLDLWCALCNCQRDPKFFMLVWRSCKAKLPWSCSQIAELFLHWLEITYVVCYQNRPWYTLEDLISFHPNLLFFFLKKIKIKTKHLSTLLTRTSQILNLLQGLLGQENIPVSWLLSQNLQSWFWHWCRLACLCMGLIHRFIYSINLELICVKDGLGSWSNKRALT